MQPNIGALALNESGHLGLILVDETTMIRFDDGSKGIGWLGIHVGRSDGHMPGTFWYSFDPDVLAHIEDLALALRAVNAELMTTEG